MFLCHPFARVSARDIDDLYPVTDCRQLFPLVHWDKDQLVRFWILRLTGH